MNIYIDYSVLFCKMINGKGSKMTMKGYYESLTEDRTDIFFKLFNIARAPGTTEERGYVPKCIASCERSFIRMRSTPSGGLSLFRGL